MVKIAPNQIMLCGKVEEREHRTGWGRGEREKEGRGRMREREKIHKQTWLPPQSPPAFCYLYFHESISFSSIHRPFGSHGELY